MNPKPSAPRSPAYQSLLAAGPRLLPLQQVHCHLFVSGLHRSLSLLTKLLTFTISSGSLSYARNLLSSIPNPDSFLFDSIIRASSKSHFSLHSLLFYTQMRSHRLPPSNYTFTSVIKACADISASSIGRIVHAHVVIAGFGSDCYVQTGLVVFYAKCGELGYARLVFDKMPERSVVAWNAMISGYEQNGFADRAIEVFVEMRKERVEPNSATLVGVLAACSQTGSLGLGKWADGYILDKGFDVDVVLGTSLVNMYARCGHVERAREIFDGLREKNVVAWTAMIAGYGMHGYGESAVKLFLSMRHCGPSPNDVTFVAAVAEPGISARGGQEIIKHYNI